ncbi:MAG: hypothetical protein Q4G36_11870 [Paracoccus sp. (in: a-proteobacteria)]|nr:hypothetical protein [Paracoccus sp. (in: a-proteobacteria)]
MKRMICAMAVLIAGSASAQECDIFDMSDEGRSYAGACTLDWGGALKGVIYHGVDIIEAGGHTYRFEYSQRQGQWAVGLLDGEAAMRYEIDRETYTYADQALTLFITTSLR